MLREGEMVPRGGTERTAYVAVSEYIFDAKRAANTNINTNRIFLWIGAIPILSDKKSTSS
jgi:hypothetical protein